MENTEVLSSPTPKAELLLYISATEAAVSAVLVQEKETEGKTQQMPIYYVSKALSTAKQYYTEMEKMGYAVLMASRKLRHYFQSHNITVPTTHPLRDMFENRESTGRIGKWAAELAEYVINYTNRSAIKSQVLADFVADWTPSSAINTAAQEDFWEIYTDGAYCAEGSGASAIIRSPSGLKLKYSARLDFKGCTNNVAEYEALLLGLRKARCLGARRVILKTDSDLVRGHIGKDYKTRDPKMAKYLEAVRREEKHFLGFIVKAIPRSNNCEADELAKAAAQQNRTPPKYSLKSSSTSPSTRTNLRSYT